MHSLELTKLPVRMYQPNCVLNLNVCPLECNEVNNSSSNTFVNNDNAQFADQRMSDVSNVPSTSTPKSPYKISEY